ncbi:hypothetical protein Hanom_Chr09g00867931 [Helianthus anomalus]
MKMSSCELRDIVQRIGHLKGTISGVGTDQITPLITHVTSNSVSTLFQLFSFA